MSENLIFIDGTYYAKSEAKISVFDHGLLYGDGIFEGMRCYDGFIFQLEEHLDRLFRSAKSLRLAMPYTKDELTEYVKETIRRNDQRDAYIRLLVTRGIGSMGLDPSTCATPSVIIISEPIGHAHGTDAATKGIRLIVSSMRRNAIDSTTHEIKSLNYLNSIQARMEAMQYNADDAILLDPRGCVAEAAICNIFLVMNKEIVTPSAVNGILSGITRRNVIELVQELGYPVVQRDVTPYELMQADEVFLTGTFSEIVGVVSINNLPIGEGEVGPVTQAIQEKYRVRRTDPAFGASIDDYSVTPS